MLTEEFKTLNGGHGSNYNKKDCILNKKKSLQIRSYGR
jgi:hypothetical protein